MEREQRPPTKKAQIGVLVMALNNQIDFDTLGKVSDKRVKEEARTAAFSWLIDLLTPYVGDEGISIVGSATLAIAVGSRTIADGTVPEVAVEIKVTAKEFNTHTTASGKPVFAYDRYDEEEAYKAEKTEKEAAAEERAKKKARKMAADNAAREKAKAEKEAKKKTEETAPE
jgi:hypothetical protein